MPTLYSLAKFCHGEPLHYMTNEQIDLANANETLGAMDALGGSVGHGRILALGC
jgi:hypothetical protein